MKLVELQQPWPPARATERIRHIAQDQRTVWHYKQHVKERLEERDLLINDIVYLLQNGFVHDAPEPSTRPELFKYVMSSPTPNSGARDVASVIIPDWKSKQLKIITVMWKDEVLRIG